MIPIIILVVGSFTHLIKFGFPSSVVFDEVYYGNFMTQYWQGSYFFDQHPPFFKIFIAFIGHILGLDQYLADWDSIGNALPDQLIWARLVPLIAGILLPLIVYAICRRFDFSKLSSFLVASLIILENSLLVQSRYILPDIFMLATGFSSILFYLEYHKRKEKSKSWFLILSIVFASITLSIKWTGLTFPFLIIIMESYRLFTQSLKTKEFIKKISIFSFKYLILAIIIYISLFIIHFNTLKNSGKGDVFMTERFQKTLTGNINNNRENLNSIGFWGKFFELNKVMYTANSGMTATHSYSSKWYTWPFMKRSIFYWQENNLSTSQTRSYIYLFGNPFVYWLGTISIFTIIVYGLYKITFKSLLKKDHHYSKILIFLIVGYIANFLPFMLIGRVMFLYHYEVALIFSIIAIGYLIDKLKTKQKTIAVVVMLIIATLAFIYWSPLTYGTKLTDKQLQERMWFQSWR